MSRTFRLGVFVVCTLAALSAGVFLIGERQFLFSSTYQVKAAFKNVVGLNAGAEVHVGGIHKGIVKKIQLPAEPSGNMTVVLEMEKSTRSVIRKDSVATIQAEGLLGNKYMEISFGSANAPAIRDGDSINGVPPLEISDLLKKTDSVLDMAGMTMVNVQEITSKVNEGEGTFGQLVNDKSFYRSLSAATDQAKAGATAFQENMEALKHNFFLRGFFSSRGYQASAKLAENEIDKLPKGQPLKRLTYDPKKLFEKTDSAKLKGAKMLNEAGTFLEHNPFGAAVIVVTGGGTGDAGEVQELSQARGMVVRDYLVDNFKMDDTRLKKIGRGKDLQSSSDLGQIEILIYGPDVQLAAQKR